jgi:hypothetical protein
MTEQEWLACTDLDMMLRHLIGKAGPRKKRLLACACCRRVWHLLPDERGRRAVAVAERYADGEASRTELAQAGRDATAAHAEAHRLYQEATGPVGSTYSFPGPPPPWEGPWQAEQAALAAVYAAAELLDDTEGGPYVDEPRPVFGPHGDVVRHWLAPRQACSAAAFASGLEFTGPRQCALLRCLFGDPFRPVSIPESVRAWNGGTVVRLARAIYAGGRFGDMAVLADALQEAGCTDRDVLAHCRTGEEHALGCWVVDALLGRG